MGNVKKTLLRVNADQVVLDGHHINIATSWLNKCTFWRRVEEAALKDKDLFNRAETTRWDVAKLVFYGSTCKKTKDAIKKVVERAMKCYNYEELQCYVAELDEHAGMTFNKLDQIHKLYTKHEDVWPLFRDGKLDLGEAIKQAEKNLESAEDVLSKADEDGNNKASRKVDAGEALDNCHHVLEWANKEKEDRLYITLTAVGLHKKAIVIAKEDLCKLLQITTDKLSKEVQS